MRQKRHPCFNCVYSVFPADNIYCHSGNRSECSRCIRNPRPRKLKDEKVQIRISRE